MQYPTHFIFNSDYPFDMIVYYKYLKFTKGTTPESFEHGLGFAPLLFGMWDESENFDQAWPFTNNNSLASLVRWIESDDKKIYIHFDGIDNGKTCYLKIYGFAPVTWTGNCKPTAQSGSSLLLNTDLPYSPLLAAGAIQPRRMDNPDTPSEQTGISEDIGKNGHIEVIGRASDVSLYYYDPIQPMVMLWKTTASTGRTAQAGFAALFGTGYGLRNAPYATYNEDTGITGRHALSITAGVTRSGMANYNDVMHFRVYG